MARKGLITAAALIALACARLLEAHHSNALFDMSTHIWITGTVVEYRPVNPHIIIELEEHRENGSARRWTVEGPRLARAERLRVEGDFVRVGDVIEVCGFFAKEDRARDSRVHGHVLIRPNGQKWQWGPYGNLERCAPRDEWGSIATGSNPLRDNSQ